MVCDAIHGLASLRAVCEEATEDHIQANNNEGQSKKRKNKFNGLRGIGS